MTHAPLHATFRAPTSSASESVTGPPWLALAIKGYLKALGGYDIHGSNPAPDIYAFTGWIPGRLSLREGFQREKEWRRLHEGWERGHVLITLGTGEIANGLVPLHAYGVLGEVHDGCGMTAELSRSSRRRGSEGAGHFRSRFKTAGPRWYRIGWRGRPRESSWLGEGERYAALTSDSSGTFTMRWDAVCSEFAAVYLNWNPRFKPVSATRQWCVRLLDLLADIVPGHGQSLRSCRMPLQTISVSFTALPTLNAAASSPRYRLTISQATKSLSLDMPEVWILLSQHITNKDRPLDDIALHVFGDHTRSGVTSKGAQRAEGLVCSVFVSCAYVEQSPYTNGVHTLVSSAVIPLLSAQSRYQPRRAETILIVVPARDRGLYRTDFTLQALASSSTTITLERIRHSLPFKKVVTGALSQRNAGGHAGWPSWMNNPQYTLTVSPGGPKRLVVFNVILTGDKGMAWNAKLMWGRGELVTDLTQDVIVAESGAYSYGMAYLTVPSLEPGTYTLAVSSFEPSKVGAYSLSVESSHPIDISAIPTEGAGMFSRVVSGTWSEETAGGRPSNGSYHLNPRIEVILPKPSTLICRLQLRHPPPPSTPLNLTMFRRAPSAQLGDQVTTSGPYSDALSGVTTGRVKLDAGIYMLVVSAWEAGMAKGLEWEVRIWSDGAVSAGLCT
jgi:calpain-7